MERRPIGIDNEDDEKSLDSPRARTPMEVLGDWLRDRQHHLEHDSHDDEDDEEEDDDSDSPRSRISRTLRGFFKKNVTKESIPGEPVVMPEHAVLGSVVEIEESKPEDSTEEESAADTAESTSEEEEPEATPEAPASEPEEDEDAVVTTSSHSIKLPMPTPAVVNVPGSGGGNINTPPPIPGSSGGVGGNVPPAAVVGGGNFAPGGSTIIERQPIVENHHHHNRRAALAALVIAERIDHHRNEKRKEQIKKVEKANEDYKKQNEDRLSRLEQPKPAAPEKVIETPVVPKIESAPRPGPFRPLETVPGKVSQPQSVKEVLQSRQTNIEKPVSLADLEHNAQKQEEHLEREDILVAAEKLASRAGENISHEVYDERWHEVKDPDSTDGFGKYQRSGQGQTQQAATTLFSDSSSSSAPASSPMFDPSKTTPPTAPDDKKPISALWVALVVGVIFAIMLIAL